MRWQCCAWCVRAGRIRSGAIVPLAMALACILALAACSLVLSNPSASGPAAAQGISAPVKVVHGQDGQVLVIVPVTIAGHGPFNFALDTGSSISLIDRPLSRMLGLPVVGPPRQIVGIGGGEQVLPIRVQKWNAGPIRLPAATVASANLPSDRRGQGLKGLLGSDILSRFGKVTIDYANGMLTVYQQIAVVPDRFVAPVLVAVLPTQRW
jgi:hypothetical protein